MKYQIILKKIWNVNTILITGESNPYISFGPSAHSYDTKKRWWNVKSLDKYLSLVGNGKLPVENFEILKKQDKYNEMILNGLRLTKGISLNKIKKFHKNHLIYLKNLQKNGIVLIYLMDI